MAHSIQKRVRFSKGQIAPELVERTDLDIFDSSAQEIKNLTSTVYGGLKTRRGTTYCSKVYGSAGTTGTVTSNMGGTASAIQNITNTYTTSNIGTATNIFTIDYGSELTDVDIVVAKLKMTGQHYFATGSQTFTIVDAGNYRIRLCGGGGGAGGGTYGSGHKTTGANGGSGAVFDAVIKLSAGSYTISVGSGGSGGAAGNSTGATGSAGTATTLKRNSDGKILISCGGGKGGTGRGNGIKAGAGGTLSHSATIVTSYTVKNGTQGSTSGYYGGTYGAGGAGVYKHAGGAGVGGYAQIGTAFEEVKFSVSSDNNTWTEVTTSNIGTSAVDIFLNYPSFRYLKADIIRSTSFSSITGQMSLNFVRASMAVSTDAIKMIPFVFNNEQAYIIILANGKISVYYNGGLVQEISAGVLQESYIKDIKYAVKDDTIILTHKDMKPQQLQRTNAGWVLSDFPFTNAPYYAFNGETKATKSVSITPSDTEGAIKITAASSVFSASDVGQFIDGNGGRVRITEYTSNTVVKGVTIIPFYTTDAITSWTLISGYEVVWSATRGYPRTCLFAQQRLWFGGSRDLPTHLWASRINDYNNFKNAGNYANDAIDVELLTNNPILNIIEQRGIHIFTAGEEWTAAETSLTPNEISIKCNTKNGSLAIEPAVVDGVIMYIEKTGHSLLGYVYNYEQASFVSDNMSILSNLVNAPVDMAVENSSSTDRGDFLFIVLADGTMLTACIAMSEHIFSISKFVTDGVIKDVCCLPDATYLIVYRNGINFLEKLDYIRTDMTQRGYVDGDTIPNMAVYKGKRVAVYDDEDLEICYVDDDEINLSKEYDKEMNVGILFDYRLESNPIAINNKTMTCKKRISKATVYCKDTEKLQFNGQKKSNQEAYEFYACTPYKDDVRFIIEGEYYPVHILSITLNLNFEG